MTATKPSNLLDYLAVLLLVVSSGMPVIQQNIPNEKLWPIECVLFGILWLIRGGRYSVEGMVVIGFFAVITLSHTIFYWGAGASSTIGFLIMLCAAYFALHSISNFSRPFIDWMSVIALVSIPIYILFNIGLISGSTFMWVPASDLGAGNVHAWFYNFTILHKARNTGPFWEPGVFAGYLTLALTLAIISDEQTKKWKFVVLIVAMILTFSTTGFLAIIAPAALWLKRWRGVSDANFMVARALLVSLLLACAFGIAMISAPHLGQKIAQQIERLQRQEAGFEVERVGSLMMDLEFIAERPIIGWTPSEIQRNKVMPHLAEYFKVSGNGFSGFATKFGVFALFFVLFRIFLVGKRVGLTGFDSGLVVLTVVILLQGEQFLMLPVFWALVMRASILGGSESPLT